MANRVIHSMKGQILARTENGRYVMKPEDSLQIEFVPFEKFHKVIFPSTLLDGNGLLKEGSIVELVRVSNGWIYPNHKVYNPLKIK